MNDEARPHTHTPPEPGFNSESEGSGWEKLLEEGWVKEDLGIYWETSRRLIERMKIKQSDHYAAERNVVAFVAKTWVYVGSRRCWVYLEPVNWWHALRRALGFNWKAREVRFWVRVVEDGVAVSAPGMAEEPQDDELHNG